MRSTLEQIAKSREIPAEPVFAEPWEARAFGLAVTLVQNGRFKWEDFREKLIAEIAAADAVRVSSEADPSYYECWLRALEGLLREKTILTAEEIDHRAEAIAASPPEPTKALSRGPVKIA